MSGFVLNLLTITRKKVLFHHRTAMVGASNKDQPDRLFRTPPGRTGNPGDSQGYLRRTTPQSTFNHGGCDRLAHRAVCGRQPSGTPNRSILASFE